MSAQADASSPEVSSHPLMDISGDRTPAILTVAAGTPGYPRRTGRALTEDFYIECKNYVDPQDDKISQYSFSIRGVGLHFEKILKFGIDTKDKFVFPLGCWDLWVKIEDEWGAFIKVNIGRFCTSLPSRRERREWNKRQELERALGEGNQARISQLSIAETSIANKELSDDPWEITTTTPASPQEDVKTTTMDPELQKAIEKKKKIELDKIQTEAAKFKKRMFKNLESNNVDNLDDCTQQMSTVSAIIGDGDTIDLNGRDMAVDMLCGKCMTMILLNTSLIDPAMAEGYVGSTMQGISSLIKSNSKKVIGDMVLAIDVQTATLGEYSSATEVNSGDQGTIGEDEELSKEKTLGLQKAKAMEHGAQSLRSADLAMNKLLSIVYPGEEPVTIVTEDGLVMTLAIMYGHTLKGYELWQGGGLYILPDLCDILKEEKVAPGNCSSTEKGTSVYGIQAIAWMSIVQSYGDGAKDKLSHNTKTMQIQLVEISDTGVELVPVEDLDPESEVIIYVPRLNDEGKAAQKQKQEMRDTPVTGPIRRVLGCKQRRIASPLADAYSF
ncbi:uncharacterized protein LOC121866534 [Homarus americanus]|uniref:uncharacterized protein LOC121866534 n=1 Tax=Homarus americanus TaxID=6706 RepID=UPI001C457EBE|nr:uncharacterized protein LOC121866534 [Homarus americanus]